LALFPQSKVLIVCHGSKLAEKFSRDIRELIIQNEKTLKIRLAPDSRSVSRWNLASGGSLMATGIDGTLTGFGYDLIVADDLIKSYSEAFSPAKRKHLWDFFWTVLFTRLEKNGSIILTGTRWSQGDLLGRILSERKDEWPSLILPATAKEDDILGRKPGQALCPEFFDEAYLADRKKSLGISKFGALYDQDPNPAAENIIFNPDWWRYYDELPEFEATISSWDCAMTSGDQSDYSVGTVWGIAKDGYYLVDLLRKRLEFPQLIEEVKLQAQRYNPQRILIEYAMSGISLVQSLLDETRLPVKGISVAQKGSKLARARRITPLLDTGKVILPTRALWLDDFLSECTLFPHASHDDMVDSMTLALNFITDHPLQGQGRPRKRPSSGRELLYGDWKLGGPRAETDLFLRRRTNLFGTWIK
jgi:predicted phage terminase large subunit-like protein